MKSKVKCDDDQKSLSKEERKQNKEERQKKKKERLKDIQNSTDVEQACEQAAENISLDVSEGSKKKRKRKTDNSDSADEEMVSGINTSKHSIKGDDKIKRQKTENIEQTTNTQCDLSVVKSKSKKKKRKKEKTTSTDKSCDADEGVSEDVTQSVKKKTKKSKTELTNDESIMPEIIDSTLLEIDSDINHEKKSKKQKHRLHLGADEEIKNMKSYTDSKEKHSSLTQEESSNHKKKNKKHSTHKDCVSDDETDSNILRKKHKNKSTTTGSVSGKDEVQANIDEHGHQSTQDSTNHVASDTDISSTGHKKHSKHKKQKNHLTSPAVDTVKDLKGKQEFSTEILECIKPTADQLMKTEPSSGTAAVTSSNWQGNLFESNERQNKFLRLLGGMKKSSNDTAEARKDSSATLSSAKRKGLFGSLASLSHKSSSVAMGVNAAANLNQKLEDEYNRAMNFKLSGKVGTGFGFVKDPAEGKKFHIDVNKLKSIKFDD